MSIPKYIKYVDPEASNFWAPVGQGPITLYDEFKTIEVPTNFVIYREFKPHKDSIEYTVYFRLHGEKFRIDYELSSQVLEELSAHPGGLQEDYVARLVLDLIIENHYPDLDEFGVDVLIKAMTAEVKKAKTGTAETMKFPTVLDADGNPAAEVVHEGNIVAKQSHSLPGMYEKVKFPCECAGIKKPHVGVVRTVIMHLNDSHEWTRESIADWLDELHDKGEINIEFQPWDENATAPVEPGITEVTLAEDPDNMIDWEKEALKFQEASPVEFTDGWKNVGYTTEPVELEINENNISENLDNIDWEAQALALQQLAETAKKTGKAFTAFGVPLADVQLFPEEEKNDDNDQD